MLNDVTGSITFSTASPDPFTSVTCAQGEPVCICEKHRAASGRPANSGVQWQMPIELHDAGQWAQGPLEDIRPSGHPHEVCLWLFGQRHSHQCWRSFCRALAVLILFLLAQRSRYWSCWWVKDLLRPCPALRSNGLQGCPYIDLYVVAPHWPPQISTAPCHQLLRLTHTHTHTKAWPQHYI